MTSELKLLNGKDDWLFLDNDTNQVISQTVGKFNFPNNFYSLWRDLFKYRRDRAKDLGYKYVYSVAPNKETVYNRYLPEGLSLSQRRPVLVVESAAKDVLPFYHPLQEIMSTSHEKEVYSKGDTHWNGFGGHIFYEGLMRSLDLTPVPHDKLVFKRFKEKASDLSARLGLVDSVWKVSVKVPSTRQIKMNYIKNIGRLSVYESRNKSLPSAVIFHDSFMLPIMRLVAENFSRVTMVWQPNIDYSIIERERPDIVISQQAERFLIKCPDDISGPSHPEWVASKQAKLA